MSKLLIPKTEQEALELLCIDDEQPTERDIRKAYRKFSLLYHPDKGGDDDDMKAFNIARDLLINRLERQEGQHKKQESERQRREEERRERQESERQRTEEERREKQESEGQRRRGEISFELIEALKCRNLTAAKKLIKEVQNFNTDLSVEFVYRFTCNACKSNDWFKFFQEFLLDTDVKVNLDANYTFGSIGTALNYACFMRNQNVVELLLKHNANVNKVNLFNKAPIQFATTGGNIEIVRLLLEKGADPYLGDPNAVQIATSANNAELVTLFHQHLNSKLCQAFEDQDLKKVKELVKKVGNVSTCSNSDPTPLGCLVKNACKSNGWFEFFQEILSEQDSKIDLNIDIDPSGTALHYACNQENKNVIELLLKHGADVNKISGSDNKPPIHSLLISNSHELAGLLYNRGATTTSIIPEVKKEISANTWYDKYTEETMKVIVKGADFMHRTQMLECFLNNKTSTDEDIEIIQLLLKYQNVDPHLDLMQVAIKKGNTKLRNLFSQCLNDRLSQDLMYEKFETAKKLIGKLEDFNKFNMEYHNPDHENEHYVPLLRYLVENACESDDWFKFFREVLLNRSTEINLDIDYWPLGGALHYACSKESKNVVELLLERKADVNKTSDHKTPIYFAATKGNTEIVQSLLDRGADPHLGNPNAVQIANQANNSELKRLFSAHTQKKVEDPEAEFQDSQRNTDKPITETDSFQGQQPIDRFMHENVNYAYYNTSGHNNNCLLHALFGDVPKEGAIAIREEGRAQKMREEIKDFIKTGYKKLVEGNVLELVERLDQYFNHLPPEDRERDIKDLEDGKQLCTTLIPIIMLLGGIEKLTLFNHSIETRSECKSEYVLPSWTFDLVNKNKEVWEDSNVKECAIFRDGTEHSGHYSRAEVISPQEHVLINEGSECSTFDNNQNSKEILSSRDNSAETNPTTTKDDLENLSKGTRQSNIENQDTIQNPQSDKTLEVNGEIVNNHNIMSSRMNLAEATGNSGLSDNNVPSSPKQSTNYIPKNTASVGGVFNHGPLLTPADTYVYTKTNVNAGLVQTGSLLSNDTPVASNENGTDRVAAEDIGSEIGRDMPREFELTEKGCHPSQIDASFTSNQDSDSATSSTLIANNKDPGNNGMALWSECKGKVALGVVGLCTGAIAAYVLGYPVVALALAVSALAILMVAGISKVCKKSEGPGTEKSNVSVSRVDKRKSIACSS